jgi:hypothetical protein
MTWKTSFAIMITSLILAGPVAAQAPSGGSGRTTTPGTPGTTTPGMPGSPTPGTPGSSTPGMPGSTTPGLSPPSVNDSSRNLSIPCPPGQARRPGHAICMPSTPGAPTPR